MYFFSLYVIDLFLPLFLRAVPFVSLHLSVDFVFIYIVTSLKRKEKILFYFFFLFHNYRPHFLFCVTTVYFFFKKKTSDRQAKFIITQQSLSLFVKHIHLHYEILLRPVGEKERERERKRKI